MGLYRKKPVTIQAERFRMIHGPDMDDVSMPECVVRRWFRSGWWVKTLEGWYRVNLGDYIITGVRGEHYPCRADIFEETYVPVRRKP